MKQTEYYSPIILQLQLQLKALNLHFSLSVVFQDFRIWFTVFWGSSIPDIGPILGSLLRPKGRQVPDHVTVGAAVRRMKNWCEAAEKSDTNLPRGVVRPIPLYILTLGDRRVRRWPSHCSHTALSHPTGSGGCNSTTLILVKARGCG